MRVEEVGRREALRIATTRYGQPVEAEALIWRKRSPPLYRATKRSVPEQGPAVSGSFIPVAELLNRLGRAARPLSGAWPEPLLVAYPGKLYP